MNSTLEKISRLYDLVAEMRVLIKELHEVKVCVQLQRTQRSYTDPLDAQAGVHITLMPGCDLLDH